MKIKTITAKNFSEALSIVKKDLGEDAVILSSEEVKGQSPCVKVIAAIDLEEIRRKENDSFKTQLEKTIYSSECKSEDIKVLKEEINSLKEMIERLHTSQLKTNLSGERKNLMNYLLKLNIWEDYCLMLCDGIKSSGDLVNKMEKDISVEVLGNKKFILFLGPTGVGKTTTIAKLCAKAVGEGKKVGIINLDTYRIGAIEQIRIYANVIGIPLKTVNSIDRFVCEAGSFNDFDMVFIDTPGKNPKNTDYINELSKIFETNLPIESHLLFSLTIDNQSLKETYKIYNHLPIDFINFSKADEAFSYGNVYNIAKISKKPISFITTGQKVPQDISFPKKKALIYMILKNEVVQ